MTSPLDERADTWISRLARGAASFGICCALSACANATTTLPEALTSEGGAAEGQQSTSEGGAGAGAEPTNSNAAKPDWCSVRDVMRTKCQRCHGDPAEQGAPFALLSYADVLVEDKRGTPRFVKMQSAIDRDYMPATFLALEPPVEALSADEKSLLLDWLAQTPPAEGTCD